MRRGVATIDGYGKTIAQPLQSWMLIHKRIKRIADARAIGEFQRQSIASNLITRLREEQNFTSHLRIVAGRR